MRAKLFILLLFISISIFSQEKIDESEMLINNGDNTAQVQQQAGLTDSNALGAGDYLVVVLVFILVLGALYFVLKFIRKVGGSRVGIDNDLIHVISTRALKGTTALHLVEVGNQVFLVGATDHSVNAISEITDQESKDMIKLNLSVDNTENKSFVQFFTEKLKSNNVAEEPGTKATPDLNLQKDRLNRF